MSQFEKKDGWSAFLDSQEKELLNTPAADLLEGEDIDALRTEKRTLFSAARFEASRRRLAAAKDGSQLKAASAQKAKAEVVDISKARAFVQAAMNDPLCTLAARNMDEMSDEDVMRIYQQLKQLKPGDDA